MKYGVYKSNLILQHMASSWNSFDSLFDNASEQAPAPKKRRRSKKDASMSLAALPVESKDVAAACPDILDTAEQAISTRAQIVAETSFFNNKNTPFWKKDKDNWSVMRPFDAPFIRALLQQAPQETLSPETARHKDIERAKTEVVPRAYEERYLCEPTGNQRPCVMAQQCQGMQLPHIRENAFVLREFLLPSQEDEWKRSGKLPQERQLCLMCKRAEILRAFVNVRADNMGVKSHMILQDYRNLVNVPGEYMLEDCILSSPTIYQGLLDPVVMHVKNAYRLKTKNGVRFYEQWRMRKPDEHFLM